MAERVNDFTQEDISSGDAIWINDVPKDNPRLDMILLEQPVRFNKWWAGKDGQWKNWQIKTDKPYITDDSGQIPLHLVKEGKYGPNIQAGSYAFLVLLPKEETVKVWEVTKKTLKTDLMSIARTHKGNFSNVRVIARRNDEGEKTTYSVTDVETVDLSSEQTEIVTKNYINIEEKYDPEVYNNPVQVKSGNGQELTDEDHNKFEASMKVQQPSSDV